MKLIGIFLALTLFVSVGCQNGTYEFTQVVQDHRQITVETADAILLSIQADLEKMRSSGVMTPEMEQGAKSLMERLEIIKKQSVVMADYIDAAVVDTELLARLVGAKWTGE